VTAQAVAVHHEPVKDAVVLAPAPKPRREFLRSREDISKYSPGQISNVLTG
jgi:hypothetical protein